MMYHASLGGYSQPLGTEVSHKQGAIKSMTPSPLLKPMQPGFYDNGLLQHPKPALSSQMQTLQ